MRIRRVASSASRARSAARKARRFSTSLRLRLAARGDAAVDELHQDLGDRADHHRQHLVVRAGDEQPVELARALDPLEVAARGGDALGLVDVGLQRVEVGAGRALAGEAHHQVLDVDARLGQLGDRDRAEAQQVADDVVHPVGVARLDERSALGALVQADDAGDLEAAQRFAQGVAADAELQRELALGRQLVARAQRAGGDLGADAVADLLEGAAGVDRLEHRGEARRGRDGLGGRAAGRLHRSPHDFNGSTNAQRRRRGNGYCGSL